MRRTIVIICLLALGYPAALDLYGQGTKTETLGLLKQLKLRYHAIDSLSANIAQTKTSPWLKRPFHSKATLTLKDGVITWQNLKPTQNALIIKDGSISGKDNQAEITPQAKALFSLISSLLRAEWDAIEQSLSLSQVSPHTLKALPKAGHSLDMIGQLQFDFDNTLNIERIFIKGTDEETEIKLSQVTITTR